MWAARAMFSTLNSISGFRFTISITSCIKFAPLEFATMIGLFSREIYKDELIKLRARMLRTMRSIDDPLFEQLEAVADAE